MRERIGGHDMALLRWFVCAVALPLSLSAGWFRPAAVIHTGLGPTYRVSAAMLGTQAPLRQNMRSVVSIDRAKSGLPSSVGSIAVAKLAGRTISARGVKRAGLAPSDRKLQHPKTPSVAPMVLGYYVPGAAALADLKAHAREITAIAPFWYSLRINGTLNDLGSSVRLTRWCVAHHIAVYPMVINGYGNTNVLQNPTYYARDLGDLLRLAKTSGYAGLNVDFESLNNNDEVLLDRFVAALGGGLHREGKKLIVSVGPRTSSSNGYHVYNYESLGKSANYVDLMLYDEHDNTSGPGPVAGLQWADAIMQYARATIPAAKILVGLAGYGYNWASSGSTTVTDAQALSLANRYGYSWDGGSVQEPEVTYTVGGVRHIVWFEDSYSEAFKVQWVSRYRLGGVALWSLGEENSRVWSMLRMMLGRRLGASRLVSIG